MSEPNEILDAAVRRAETDLARSFILDSQIRENVSYVALNLKNRAEVRLLMACLLAKLHRSNVDIRKPYTEIGGSDVFSGRTYDERYITNFINRYNLPCNSTTAFLTPALRILSDDRVVTCYEMKHKRVTRDDLDRALQKISDRRISIDNYIFITTEAIDLEVQDYARSLYQTTGGIEFVILDCINFTRHFLHLFHRLRSNFLETYQELILAEPQSAVSQPVKEAFLAMRQAAETGIENGEIEC